MKKISVSYLHGNKIFRLYPFDAYIGEISGKGRKYGYYIQLARGTQNLNKEAKRTTFDKKADAERFIRQWLTAKYAQYEAKEKLKNLRYGRRR
jgi:hypothetical protein